MYSTSDHYILIRESRVCVWGGGEEGGTGTDDGSVGVYHNNHCDNYIHVYNLHLHCIHMYSIIYLERSRTCTVYQLKVTALKGSTFKEDLSYNIHNMFGQHTHIMYMNMYVHEHEHVHTCVQHVHVYM